MVGPRKIIEIAANLAILLVCGLIGWTFLTHKGLASGSGKEVAHLEGVTLPPLPGYSWSDHQKTLVLAIRKGCHYCDSSLPFYKQLSNLEKSRTLHAHLVAVMPDDRTSVTADLLSGGVSIEAVFNQQLSSIRVAGTPTLFLVDAKGRIEQSWVGQLSPESEKDVIAAAAK